MNAVLKGLLEITLYSLVIAGAIMLFRLAFRKSISPKLQYFIWALLILRLAFPITIESGLHFEIFFPKQSMDETHTLGSKAQPAALSADCREVKPRQNLQGLLPAPIRRRRNIQ